MALPGQSVTIRDPGLGLVDAAPTRPLVVGITSAGTAATLYSFSSIASLVSTLGQGPAVEHAAKILQVAGGPVDVLKTAGTTAGAAGAVTQVGTGPTVTVAGASFDSYEFESVVVAGGALGTATFKYSLDDGRTYSDVLTIPSGGTYAIPNTNNTLTFAAGTYVVGTTYSFDTTAPLYTTGDLSTALAAAFASTTEWAYVVFVGEHSSGANAATMAAAIDAHMVTFANTYQKEMRAIMDAGTDTPANVKTAFASFAATNGRILVQYGDADQSIAKPFAGWGTPRVPATMAVAMRAAQAVLSSSLGRVASGPLQGVVAISHDEFQQGAPFDGTKISTLRTIPSFQGFFITRGELKSAAGSDFKYWQWGRVIDLICRTIRIAQGPFLNANMRVKTDGTGQIAEKDAVRVETAVRRALRAAVQEPKNEEGTEGHVSGIAYNVDRTNNVLTTQTLRSESAAVPLVPAEQIATTVGLTAEIV